MFVDHCWAIAIYCQRCGKIHIHEISYFLQIDRPVFLKCNCSHHQATITRTITNCFKVEIPCVVCDFVHKERFFLKSLLRMKAEKIYCAKDRFELGYVGKKQKIEEILLFNRQRFAMLQEGCNSEELDDQENLLEVLNRVHDIAEDNGIHCSCGSKAITADIIGSSVILECCRCGGYFIVPAKTVTDMEKINTIDQIELMQGRFFIKNIDLD